MPSNSPNIDTIKNVEREPTPRKSGADLAESSMTAGSEGPQEQKISENGSMHSQSQRDPKQNSDPPLDLPLPKLSDPLKTQIPKPAGDPFEHVLKSMREKDTVQCDAWKDEVQNILIFAGLFSAVVTAFILESYQRLQPDRNDAIVGLLAHIAEKLDNPSMNATASVSSIVAETNFSPSHSDVAINVFWFISLVLSLTVALIGIITLQWLREHQRYDSTLKPRETMAVLNARLHSLTQWYVPQIFAGLPLLLQGAIVLFFAGMIEFLFALSLDVAIPVLLSICIPVLFLIATTLLPVLQVCVLQHPDRLSINNDLPSPCPYKSPQSLIARRFSTASEAAFKYLAFMVAGAYVCVIHISYFARKLCGHHERLPILRMHKITRNLIPGDWFLQSIRWSLRNSGVDWTSIDKTWLEIRTTYAVYLQLVHSDNNDLIAAQIQLPLFLDSLPELPNGLPTDLVDEWRHGSSISLEQSLLPEVLDCSHAIMQVLAQVQVNTETGGTAYHCLAALCSQPFQRKEFYFSLGIIQAKSKLSAAVLPLLTNLCVAFGRHLFYSDSGYVYTWQFENPLLSSPFVEDVINNEPSTEAAEILSAAFMVSSRKTFYYMRNPTNIEREWSLRLAANRLAISPQRLFSMSNWRSWLPEIVYSDIISRQHDPLGNYSQSITKLFLVFLENCSLMKSSPELLLRPAPALEMYGGILVYMEVIVCNQGDYMIADSLAQLTQLCNLNEDIIQEKPFLIMAACFYLEAAAKGGHVGGDEPLVKLILDACGIEKVGCHEDQEWDKLDDAIDAIYRRHNPSQMLPLLAPPLDQSGFSASLTNPNGHNNV